MNVFVVDSSKKFLKSFIDYLSDIPNIYLSGIASNITSAITGIGKVNPDIVIWSVNMVGEDYFEAVQNIKNRINSPILILYISLLENGYKEMYKKTGADYVMKKTDDPSILPELLKKIDSELLKNNDSSN